MMGAIAATAVKIIPQKVLLAKILLNTGCPTDVGGAERRAVFSVGLLGGVCRERVMVLFFELNKTKCMLSQK